MNRVFPARILPASCLALLLFAYLLVHAFWVKSALLALFCMVVLVLVVERIIHTSYTLTPAGRLVVDRGRFRKQRQIDLADIVQVEQLKAPLFGALLVSHYVLLHCKGGKTIALTPVREDEFVLLLRERMRQACGN